MEFSVPDDLSASPDLEEARRALSILTVPESTFEIRSLPSGRSWIGRDHAAAIAALPALSAGTGVYYTLNPLRPDLTRCATNKDVVERRSLLIDIDSIRPDTDLPATDPEKQYAAGLTDRVVSYLSGFGFPDPAVIDSGNGFQLVYRIDIPNNELSHSLVSSLLYRLAAMFDAPGARIDTSVHNAGRIGRLPGTWNRKGPPSADRPHRLARMLIAPEDFRPVAPEALRAAAGLGEASEAEAATPVVPRLAGWTVPDVSGGDCGAWFRKALTNESASVMTAPAGTRHLVLRAATRTMAGYIHHGFLTESEIVAALRLAGERAGLDAKDIRDVIAWGVTNGIANPLSWPEKLGRPVSHAAGESGADATVGRSGRSYRFPLVVRGSDVIPKKIHWLWPDRIPFGFLTLFAGRTGVGKSFVTLDVAARLTTGEEIPLYGGECFSKASVLIISEDSHDYVLTPRLIEAGADMGMIHYMTWEAMTSFTLADTQMLDDVYEGAGQPKLVVIDPPTNFLGARDEHKNAEVRSALMGISVWAMRHDVACVMITHCNKGVKKDMAALDRIIGSVAWASTSRIAHIFAPDPDQKHHGFLLPLKSNIGQLPDGLAYAIEKTETIARVRWLNKIDFSADDALSGEKKKKKGVVAVEWLAERFREQRQWPSDELKQSAREAGLDKNALWSPEVMALPIHKHPIVNAQGNRHWVWEARDGWPPGK